MNNMKRAKNAWGLKMNGLKNEDIAKQLSTTVNTINKIFRYTTFDYYLDFKGEQSYYDAKLMIAREIDNEKKKLKKINNYLALKRRIFLRIFEATAVTIVLLILI